MTEDRRHVQDAADRLWHLWSQRQRTRELDAAIRPRTREDGYAVQMRLEERTALPLFGWKIAATSAAGQAHIAVDGPLAGRLLRERVCPAGGRVPFTGNHMRVAEAEFAFRMGVDLPPRSGRYETPEILQAVDTLHPAIEVPDSRYDDFTIVGAAQLIADDACADYFVLGSASPATWRTIDLSRHRVTGRVDNKTPHEGTGANVLGDPRIALTWLVNELSALGVTLAAGQVVTTGTCVVPVPIDDGDHMTADFGVLGAVDAWIGRP
jgi:2-keto-4-pentenoate hydratase